MLHILLLILKILGFVVLAVLGLALLLILLVLFVPVRYAVSGSWHGKPEGRARITWLLHILSVTVSYKEEPLVTVRILGIPIPKRVPKKVQEDLEDRLVQAMEVREEDVKAQTEELLPDFDEPEAASLDEGGSSAEGGESQGEKAKGPDKKAETPGKKAKGPGDTAEKTEGPGQPDRKRGFFTSIIDRARRVLEGILAKLKFIFGQVCGTLRNIKEKKEEIGAWIKDPANQRTLKLIYKQLKKVLRHMAPKKGRARISLGLEDPYTMGQVLTYASVIYPLLHKHVELEPIFGESVIEGEGFFKGRIRMGTLMGAAGRILLDKNSRRILRKLLR